MPQINPKPIHLPLGRVVVTDAVRQIIAHSGTPLEELLNRHCHGDWGWVDVFEAEANDNAVQQGQPVTSIYWLPINRLVYIITEGDRSRTFISLPTYSEEDDCYP